MARNEQVAVDGAATVGDRSHLAVPAFSSVPMDRILPVRTAPPMGVFGPVAVWSKHATVPRDGQPVFTTNDLLCGSPERAIEFSNHTNLSAPFAPESRHADSRNSRVTQAVDPSSNPSSRACRCAFP